MNSSDTGQIEFESDYPSYGEGADQTTCVSDSNDGIDVYPTTMESGEYTTDAVLNESGIAVQEEVCTVLKEGSILDQILSIYGKEITNPIYDFQKKSPLNSEITHAVLNAFSPQSPSDVRNIANALSNLGKIIKRYGDSKGTDFLTSHIVESPQKLFVVVDHILKFLNGGVPVCLITLLACVHKYQPAIERFLSTNLDDDENAPTLQEIFEHARTGLVRYLKD